uniref:Legume lectin domain-containing protein n=1 Tax=Nelumbo nucifera TaxID=4432 RepID=A0A822XV38_NELNU|nr:TPA_asm: hypothetical protein HUJ06_024269 [Nelumbo nucifera]
MDKNQLYSGVFSFSTSFVFGIILQCKYSDISGNGMAFVIVPSRGLPGSLPIQSLDLFNYSNNGNSSSHVVVVELDTLENIEFADINNNHVGIDVNNLTHVVFAPASFFTDKNGGRKNLTSKVGQYCDSGGSNGSSDGSVVLQRKRERGRE